jgi:TldD protein
MPVVFAPPSGGLLLHEICGHLLEADHVLAGESPFAGARGEAIASSLLSLADDGSLAGLRGSAKFDDEGIPSRRTPLIVKGTLVGYLSSRMTAHATDRISTGNGRRESYRDAPLPRMTNLVIDPGTMTCDEIIASTGHGLLVRRLGRGQVNPITGRFLLAVEEGLLIEQGRATRPVAQQALAAIDAVGGDVAADPAGVICLKEDQAIPFGTLQPTLRVASLSVAAAPS